MASLMERVRADAGPYPTELLTGCRSGLLLFGAAFQGRNDAVHMFDAGIVCDVVDIEQVKLDMMAKLYPADWHFYCADAWQFAESARARYDVVSVDCWTGQVDEVVRDLHVWCSVARRLVTVTATPKHGAFVIPPGWTPSILQRSGNANWLVLVR